MATSYLSATMNSHCVTSSGLSLAVVVIGHLLGIVCSTTSTTDASTATTTVYIAYGGKNNPDCLKGIGSCECLDYVMGNVHENMSLIIIIQSWTLGCDSTLYFDLHQSNVSFIGGSVDVVFEISHFKNFLQLSFQGFHFDDMIDITMGNSVEFWKCKFDGIFNLIKYSSVQKFHFYQCNFASSIPQYLPNFFKTEASVVFQAINDILFLDCSFQIDVQSSNVFFKFVSCKNVTYYKCSFANNVNKELIYATSNTSEFGKLTIKCCIFSHNEVQTLNGLIFATVQVEIADTIFTHNRLTSCEKSNNNGIIMVYDSTHVKLSNVTFQNNGGLGIYIFAVSLPIIDFLNVRFINNTGLRTGGIFLTIDYSSLWPWNNINTCVFKNISFQANKYTADYGGGMFVNSTHCLGYHPFHLNNIYFENEQQGISSNNLNCLQILFPNVTKKYWRLPAGYINASNSTTVPILFPGKRISIPPLVVTDQVGNRAKCLSVLSVVSQSSNNSECRIEIRQKQTVENINAENSIFVLLETTHVAQLTSFYLISTYKCTFAQTDLDIAVRLNCENANAILKFTLRECPLGYTFNITEDSMGICRQESEHLAYDESTGTVCVQNNNWYGQMTSASGNGVATTVISSCANPYCVSGIACPIAGYTDTHQTLPWTQDEQCNGLYGGLLCRSCKEHCVFTFGASNCILLSDCKEDWQPYLIVSFALVGQIVLALVLICSRSKTESGVGYLYGPLFFFAVYKLLPISHSYLQTTSPLEVTLSIYESILLLDLDILGKVPWCFFPSLNQTLNYAFRFLGPIITFTVLLVIVLIARINFCYRLRINRIVQSPIQPMCLLILLSFWSLSKTSIETIKPITIDGKWRFAIQPEYQYLGNVYTIVLFCIAISLLVFVYLPFILLLFLSQSLRARVNLFHIQPLLDAFQSSYKDNCRWYSGVYLLIWVVMNINMPSYVFIIINVGVVLLHTLVQPHKSMFLNAADALLLMDIMALSSLSYYCSDHNASKEHYIIVVLKYPLLIIPLLYILIGGVWVTIGSAIHKCGKVVFHKNSVQKLTATAAATTKEEERIDSGGIDICRNVRIKESVVSIMEREPLLYSDD